MLTKRKEFLIILVLLLALIAIAITVTDAIGQERERIRWAIPQYVIEIRGVEADDFSVSTEGKYTRPDGKIIKVEKHSWRLPMAFYVNADCSLDLKITTTEKRFRATLFYEYDDVVKWLSTADGIAGTGATFKLKPYEEK